MRQALKSKQSKQIIFLSYSILSIKTFTRINEFDIYCHIYRLRSFVANFSCNVRIHESIIFINSFVRQLQRPMKLCTKKGVNDSAPKMQEQSGFVMELCLNFVWDFALLKEVRYNCSAHGSAHFFIIAISSHSHKERKQPQIILLQYSCSVNMINIVRKYL